jgi:general secretion pathway protein E
MMADTNVKFVPNKFSRRIPYTFAKVHKVCIYGIDPDQTILVAVVNSLKPMIITEIRRKLNQAIRITKINPKLFDSLLSEAYSSANAAAIVDDIQDDIDISDLLHSLPRFEDLLESENDAPIIKIINAFFTQAVKEGASDVHLDAYERKSLVRFRRDGLLHDIVELNPGLHAALVSRIKIMAQLDIAEKRLPQDGRISLRLAGREIDLRVSTIPTGHGERVVLRLLDKNKEHLQLEYLGMGANSLVVVDRMIRNPHGIFLVTGPTGSGKSTTLYASLARLDAHSLNIMTVEDPIEYDIEGISQTQINAKIEMSFARALRSILRQDPDVVMIGEIRDLETAEIAVQASLTGHLVLATLHTNNAASAVTRLIDMGVESFLLSSTLIGSMAQRLIRVLCSQCKVVNDMMEDSELRTGFFGLPDDAVVYKAVGCEACNHTGYKGRRGIYELLVVNDKIQRMIHNRVSESEIEQYAIKNLGMQTLRMDAIRYIISGDTSIEEVTAVTTGNLG